MSKSFTDQLSEFFSPKDQTELSRLVIDLELGLINWKDFFTKAQALRDAQKNESGSTASSLLNRGEE